MRSIRLSLMVNFLALLSVGLGVALLLAYRSAQTTLDDRSAQTTAQLIEAKFQQRCAEEQKRLDDALLDQSMALAGRVKIKLDWSRMNNRWVHGVAGVWTMPMSGPYGYLTAASWLVQFNQPYVPPRNPGGPPRNQGTPPPPVAYDIWRGVIGDLALTESDLDLPPNQRGPGDYHQIDTNHYSKPLRSESLRALSFPSPGGFGADNPILHKEIEDYELAPGQTVRLARVKIGSHNRVIARMMNRGGRTDASKGPPAPRRFSDPPRLYIVMQVGASLDKLNETIDALRAQPTRSWPRSRWRRPPP